ncbi:SUMF1/EgtB/PvdO family nonheme iron enzyme [Pendulispora albinea]|uniref:SUMF1/EgtB/PvdO family nonheme iron enzyme n=1 Tax=Pendulispora albinea TaxID=2741071 RepID=A0ABZ2M8G8_9BACT
MTKDPLQIEGQTIAEKYRVERAVGEGGFAVVYRAIHTIWNRPVAIKFFHALSLARLDRRELFMQAFIQEGALLTELSSQTASIVQARDIGTYMSPQGHWIPYMVLEWLEGCSLDELLEHEREEKLPPWSLTEMMNVIGPVASALEVAHARGIAHRDIKPGNLFLIGDRTRGKSTVKVLDFGVAKMMADNTDVQAALAKTGASVQSFSPLYGAPEQFTRSYGATGPWTDVFALSLVAVEMLSGRRVLDGTDLVQLACASADRDRRPTPRALGVPVSDAVEGVFARALAVEPAKRYARCGEFLAALTSAARITPIEPPRVSVAASRPAVIPGPPSNIALEETLVSESSPEVAPPPLVPSTGSGAILPSSASPPPADLGKGRRTSFLLGAGAAILALGTGVLLAFFNHSREPSAPGGPGAVGASGASGTPAAPSQELASAAVGTPGKPAPACPEGMAPIPAGQFFMGSDAKEAQPHEKPSHNVKLGAFCMDTYEVTAKDYKACSDIGKCRRAPVEVDWPAITAAERKLYSTLCTVADPAKQDHPINCISWDMATTFCKARDKRLPTEAEWEYTARGPDGRTYPWGDEEPLPAHLNACGTECVAWGKSHHVSLEALYPASDGYPTTAPVGQFPSGKSRFGPFDVVGNVWEWTADWYGDYGPDDGTNPAGPASGERRVIRGGAFNGSFASWLRPSFRYAQDPKAQSHGIGFRCAKSL